jgi:hypothetical protein
MAFVCIGIYQGEHPNGSQECLRRSIWWERGNPSGALCTIYSPWNGNCNLQLQIPPGDLFDSFASQECFREQTNYPVYIYISQKWQIINYNKQYKQFKTDHKLKPDTRLGAPQSPRLPTWSSSFSTTNSTSAAAACEPPGSGMQRGTRLHNCCHQTPSSFRECWLPKENAAINWNWPRSVLQTRAAATCSSHDMNHQSVSHSNAQWKNALEGFPCSTSFNADHGFDSMWQPQLQIKVVSYASQSRTAKEIKEVILNHTWK